MVETYYAGAYWPGRVEPLESYARRAETFFRLLSSADPTFSRWLEKAGSRSAALKLQFTPNAETLLGLFEKKQYRRDEAGISFSAWNGEPDGASSAVRFACGSTSPLLGDFCTLNLPTEGAVRERILSATSFEQVLRAMVLAWEPEWAIATSQVHRDEVLKLSKAGTFVGWVTYFAHSRGVMPALPEPVRTKPLGDKGTLLILTPERFTASNPQHVALAAHVQELLVQSGLLKPLSPSPSPM
ncbi:immunity 52 family protein [Pyxidicoccus parkwayensis]|uniref:Immunity 52 family protein n=1 Tax=Pyxidicoccus parkwayensis TaxID=2813578 RepID=A0ABX7NZZ0_9BACT|nr:immunity 52 family protein [Pyxidicoccus parkwaysis]QSQ23047.1 immunity 52 family protein [Pyxidicoccus parkwaysis]